MNDLLEELSKLSMPSPHFFPDDTLTDQPEKVLAAEYIREHYAEDVHIGTLLGITHVSRSYFLRLFRQYMGTTPYNFLLLTRITRAKEMLETTDLPVAEIAYEVGFQGDANFSSRFLAITGVTPGQYRRQALRSQAGAGQ